MQEVEVKLGSGLIEMRNGKMFWKLRMGTQKGKERERKVERNRLRVLRNNRKEEEAKLSLGRGSRICFVS